MKTALLLIMCVVGAVRVWTSHDGKHKARAQYLGQTENAARLRVLPDQVRYKTRHDVSVPKAKLSKRDRAWLDRVAEAVPPPPRRALARGGIQAVRKGMTRAEVVRLVGPGTLAVRYDTPGLFYPVKRIEYYQYDTPNPTGYCTIMFEGGRVTSVLYSEGFDG